MTFNPRAERAEKLAMEADARAIVTLREMHDQYESQIERLITMHEKQIVLLEAQLLDVKYEAMRELAETKKAHFETLQHVINEHEITRGELQRTLRILHPAMQSVEIPISPFDKVSQLPEEKPKKQTVPSGTPWQRVQAFYKEHEAEYAFRSRYADKPAEGETNGISSERRVDAPLGGESKPPQ
jgi:hypothetical protein